MLIEHDIPLKKYTYFKIGGTAEEIFFPQTEQDLREALNTSKKITILGGGTNVLISDDGVPGRVICTKNLLTDFWQVDGNKMLLGAGVPTPRAATVAMRAGLSGMEWGVAVPGTIGGAVVMNSSFLEDIGIAQCLESVEVLDFEGKTATYSNVSLCFAHRESILQKKHAVVLRVKLSLKPEASKLIRERMLKNLEWKRSHQPVRAASAGCVFKNNREISKIMEGMKGIRVGDAEISCLDPRFIINSDNAKAEDVMALIRLVQGKAAGKVNADLEIKLIGKFTQAAQNKKGCEKRNAMIAEITRIKARIRQWAPSFVERMAAFAYSVKAQALKSSRIKNSSLIIAPANAGSLGDEAAVLGALTILKRNKVKYVGLAFVQKGNESFDQITEFQEILNMNDYIREAGSLLRRLKSLNKILSDFGKYQKVFFLGTDVLDGYYSEEESAAKIRMAELLQLAGSEVTIVGFSIRDNFPPSLAKLFKQLPSRIRLCARDPISYERVKLLIDREPILTADAAFMMKGSNSPSVEDACRWIDRRKQEGDFLIGFNPYNTRSKNIGIRAGNELVAHYAAALKEVFERNPKWSFLFIPHDHRKSDIGLDDDQLNKRIIKELPEQFLPRLHVLSPPLHANEVKSIARHLDFVFSGRMHLVIASLGQEVPAAGIVYQDKFEGLFRHFNLEGLTITPEEVLFQKKLESFMAHCFQQRKVIQQKIQERLPAILQLAEKNFS